VVIYTIFFAGKMLAHFVDLPYALTFM